jgi:hypothetical protein
MTKRQLGVGLKINITPKEVVDLDANILTLSNEVDDATFKNHINNRASKTGFKDEIIDAFVKNHGTKKDSITIEKFKDEKFKDENSKSTNRNSHFIITHKEEKWQWHAKSAIHGKHFSLGTPFNEFAHYKLNEHLGIGPRCHGFVSKEGVVMILTEDLNFRSLKGANKEVSFSDNEKSNELESLPGREQDSVHRCVAQITINLLSLLDIEKNPGNTGFKSSHEIGNEKDRKQKLFIVDFTLNSFENWSFDIKAYADSLALILKPPSQQPLSEQPLSQQPLSQQPLSQQPKNIFKFEESPEVIGKALIKLFLDDDGEIKKFENDIEKAFKKSRELLSPYKIEDTNTDYKIPHLEALTTQEGRLLKRLNIFLGNNVIRTFLEEAGRKIKEKKLEKTTAETPPNDLSPADNSHRQLSKPREPSLNLQ